jgi:ABC-type multidrug transport system ATPase subunit
MLALVGSTGSGKSTLISLLAGMYHPNSGEVRVDGVAVKDWNFADLRSRYALVQQDVFLFSDTVRNNVTLYRPIPDSDIMTAAEAMGIKDFLLSLPGGLDYDVKERGGMLSTGQRQLLAFLSAYLVNPDVLILDEATSSVDSQSEAWIQKATETITAGRTSIVVAHRLATVLHADRIAVLEHGRVVEQGSHSALLKAAVFWVSRGLGNPLYRDSAQLERVQNTIPFLGFCDLKGYGRRILSNEKGVRTFFKGIGNYSPLALPALDAHSIAHKVTHGVHLSMVNSEHLRPLNLLWSDIEGTVLYA